MSDDEIIEGIHPANRRSVLRLVTVSALTGVLLTGVLLTLLVLFAIREIGAPEPRPLSVDELRGFYLQCLESGGSWVLDGIGDGREFRCTNEIIPSPTPN